MENNTQEEQKLQVQFEQEIQKELDKSTIPSVDAFKDFDSTAEIAVVGENASIKVDPTTGENIIIPDEQTTKYKDVALHEILDGADIESKDSIEDIKNFGLADLSDEEAMQVVELLRKVKNKEEVNVYREMPEKLKVLVRQLSPVKSPEWFKTTAREMLNQLISDINLDKEFLDFNTALSKELEIPDILSMYADHNREKLEKTLLETADKIEAEAPHKAETLRGISKSFTDSYTFVRQKELLNKPGVKRTIKKLANDSKRFHRVCDEFNYKYKTYTTNNLVINDISLLLPVLERKISDKYSYETLAKFVALLLEECKNYDPKNLAQHAFMYYSIKDILNLDHVDINLSEFNTLLVHNIEEVMDLIEK